MPDSLQRNINTVVCIVAISIAFVAVNWMCLDYMSHPDGRQRRMPPVVIEDEPEIDISGSYVVVLSESKARPSEQVAVLADNDFWHRYLPSVDVQFRILDPDDQIAQQYLEAGISPPAVVHLGKNGELLGSIAFPDSTDAIRKMLEP